MKKAALFLFLIGLPLCSVHGEKTVFGGSARYEVIIGLTYTRQTSCYGEQGGFSNYTSIGRFEDVKFGPSLSPAFDAWFEVPAGPTRSHGVIPMPQISGTGKIENYEIASVWEAPEKEIAPQSVSGTGEFSPFLELLTKEMYFSEDFDENQTGNDMSIIPITETIYFRYWENFSVEGHELQWEYPDFAVGAVESGGFKFYVPLAKLAVGEEVYITIPVEVEGMTGAWTVQFSPREEK